MVHKVDERLILSQRGSVHLIGRGRVELEEPTAEFTHVFKGWGAKDSATSKE